VAFNFTPRNLTQVTSAMKPGQECMVWFCFSKENNSSRKVILKIELELNNLNSILSRSAVTPVFPTAPAADFRGRLLLDMLNSIEFIITTGASRLLPPITDHTLSSENRTHTLFSITIF